MSTDKEFEYLAKLIQYEHNILEEYDNVTYNIRFYMIESSYQQQLSDIRRMFDLTKPYKIDDNKKIIIAETGVTSNYDITSLTMKTVHTSVHNTSSATTYQINLMLKELNGCSLTNKIATISKLLGYQNHVNQPYHLDVWFSGYEHTSGLPVYQIGDMLTYEVIISDITTNITDVVSTYNLTLTSITHGAFNKTVNSLWNLGSVTVADNTTLDGYRIAIEESMNKAYFENNPHLQDYYPSRKFIFIDNLIEDQGENKLLNNLNNSFNPLNLSNIPINSKPPEITEKSDNVYDVFGNNISDTFDGFFQRLCFKSDKLKNYIARPVYRVVMVPNKTYVGQELMEIHIDIVFRKLAYLEYFNNKSSDSSKDLNNINKMQKEELKKLIYSKGLVKKYQYLFNGRDTSVLELNSNIDRLWFACLPTYSSNNAIESSTDLKDKAKDATLNSQESQDSKSFDIRDISKTSTTLTDEQKTKVREALIGTQGYEMYLQEARQLVGSKKMYIDDLYNSLPLTIKKDALSQRNILEINESLDSSPKNRDVRINPQEMTAITGYNNIYQSGNLIELNITILGDPYWLKQFSDNVLLNSQNASVLHNFAFSLKTPIGQNPNGTYNLEDTCEFSTIYQLIESTSIFEEGKFTQQLKGVINPSFIYSGTVKV